MSDHGPVTDLASLAEAESVVAGFDVEPGVERVPLSDARDRVLGERVEADIDVPGFDRASMDGYAVRATDTGDAPVTLSLAGVVRAGEKPDVAVEAGTAVEISTGAVMPEGADAVVIVERTSERDGQVEIEAGVSPGENVMPAGADVAAGTRALGRGTRLTAREIGLLAALGRETVPVRAKPRVGIIPTGDELVSPGDPLDHGAGQIYDVNTHTIATGVEEAGGVPVRYDRVGDDVDEMEALLLRAANECDVVLTAGSTSASPTDVVHRVIEEHGSIHLHGIAVKPGKPTIVGTLEDAVYVGLPGYPVSSLSIFRRFVAPLLREASGRPEPETATRTGAMALRETFEESRHRLLPVGLVTDGAGDLLVYPVDKGSGATTSLANADGIVEMPVDVDVLERGESVEVALFSPHGRPPPVLCVGADDPLLSRLLDVVAGARFLAQPTDEAGEWLELGLPDLAVLAGPDGADAPGVELGGWTREWGLVVPAGNPGDVRGLADLVDGDHDFVNLEPGTGLRRSLDEAVGSLAGERGLSGEEVERSIAGYERTRKAHESPARMVADGRAAVGLGLRATAAALDLGFVSLGHQRVRVLADPDRLEKDGVSSVAEALADAPELADGLAGVRLDDAT